MSSDPSDTPPVEMPTPELLIRSERDFIHDLSSPLMIAHGMLESAMELESDEATREDRLNRSSEAMLKMSKLLKERRKRLIAYAEKLNVDE